MNHSSHFTKLNTLISYKITRPGNLLKASQGYIALSYYYHFTGIARLEPINLVTSCVKSRSEWRLAAPRVANHYWKRSWNNIRRIPIVHIDVFENIRKLDVLKLFDNYLK